VGRQVRGEARATAADLRDLAVRLADDLETSFPDLVLALQDGVYSGVRRLVWDPMDAEEITQDTFVRAYRALRDYEPARIGELRVAGWIWTIALNLCRNRARARSRRPPRRGADRDLERLAEQRPGPAETAVVTEETAIWSRRLAELPEPQRRAVVLRHVVGLPYQDIAAATGRPLGTVKADVHRGVARLRSIIEPPEGDTHE
jgi:RNA polymerase sigma-70 factor (ECF subfamily)